MELINDLNEEYWSRGDPTQTTGYQHYRVMKCEKLEKSGCFSYGVFDDDGMLKVVTLQNGASSRDPLTGISNIWLRLADDGEQITGVIVEDDCVLRKSSTDLDQPEAVANSGSDVIHEESSAGDVGSDSPKVVNGTENT